jgi:hypothetical protein
MTETSATPSGSSSAGSLNRNSVDQGQGCIGPFVLTLCAMEGPVCLRPPQSPELKRFTFFTTCVRQRDGREQVYLHMGYFETLMGAQQLLQAVRRRFPGAIAIRAPAGSPQSAPPEAFALHPAEPPAAVPARQNYAPVADESLTDTQVMRILEKRSAGAPQNELEARSGAEIGVLRPEDTTTRLALKEAVVQGAQVFFSVQLDWSARPIDPGRVPLFPIFKTHTLYATESLRENRRRYFLRLGFFADASLAKEAASEVRSKFPSAVVVPVTEEEIARAHETSTEGFGFGQTYFPMDPGIDHTLTESSAPKPRPVANRARRSSRDTETLEQTLKKMAAREMLNNPDSVSESGVRHLRIEVQGRKS